MVSLETVRRIRFCCRAGRTVHWHCMKRNGHLRRHRLAGAAQEGERFGARECLRQRVLVQCIRLPRFQRPCGCNSILTGVRHVQHSACQPWVHSGMLCGRGPQHLCSVQDSTSAISHIECIKSSYEARRADKSGSSTAPHECATSQAQCTLSYLHTCETSSQPSLHNRSYRTYENHGCAATCDRMHVTLVHLVHSYCASRSPISSSSAALSSDSRSLLRRLIRYPSATAPMAAAARPGASCCFMVR